MKAILTAKPVFNFTLTRAHVDLLTRLSAVHYDSVCKAAGCVGGFLYGWNNQQQQALEQQEAAPELSATWRQLDTCMKILEGGQYEMYRADWPVMHELEHFFRRLFREATDKIHPLAFTIEESPR